MDTASEKANVSQTDDTLRDNHGHTDTDLDLNDPKKLSGDLANLRLDKHGLPLVPQPTQHKDDPLVGEQDLLKHPPEF